MKIIACACCEATGVTIRNIGTFKVCESCFKKLKNNEFVPELRGRINRYGQIIQPSKPTGRHIYIKNGNLIASLIEKKE